MEVKVIVSPNEFMRIGLQVFYKERRIKCAKKSTNVKRFCKHFGVTPIIAAHVWEDLQTTSVAEAMVPLEKLKPKYFLMALNHLCKYPMEDEQEGPWDLSPKQARQWVWYFVKKIQALKEERIVWPEDWGNDIWIIMVDGMHCWIKEPNHPEWSQDKSYYSHKFAKAGLNYELGMLLWSRNLSG